MISAHELSYEYPGKRALDNISFNIEKGSITALAGPNGAGKTTLMRCLAGLDKPFSGRAFVGGLHVEENPRKVHEIMGYLSDFFGLYDHLSVRQCLTYMAWSRMIPADYVAHHVQWLTTLLGLEPVIDKKAGELSRGWRQRVGIAQSIVHNPKVLILDEPASGLDPESRHKLAEILKTLRSEHDMTILVSSHILAELEDYCDSMLILRDGRIIDHIAAGAPKEGHQAALPLFITLAGGDKIEALVAALKEHGAAAIERSGTSTLHFELSVAEDALPAVLKDIVSKDFPVSAFARRTSRLQDLYLSRAEAHDNNQPHRQTKG